MARKILLLFIVASSILAFSRTCVAAPAYGTYMPERRHWMWGFESNILLDRDLEDDNGGISANCYFLTGSFALFEWLCFDGKIGAGDVDWNRTTPENNISYDTNFAGAYGFRIKGYEIERWGIKSVAGFQHISIHPDPRNQDGDKYEAIIDEWQGSLVISKDVGVFVPYLGARYGTVDLITKTNEEDRARFKSDDFFGVILGMDFYWNERVRINLETSFLDSEEFAIGITRDF